MFNKTPLCKWRIFPSPNKTNKWCSFIIIFYRIVCTGCIVVYTHANQLPLPLYPERKKIQNSSHLNHKHGTLFSRRVDESCLVNAKRFVHLLLLVLCVLFPVNARQCQHRWSVTTGFDSRTYRASGQWASVPVYKEGRTGERRSTAANQTWPFSQHYRLFLSLALLSRGSPFFRQRQR